MNREQPFYRPGPVATTPNQTEDVQVRVILSPGNSRHKPRIMCRSTPLARLEPGLRWIAFNRGCAKHKDVSCTRTRVLDPGAVLERVDDSPSMSPETALNASSEGERR